MRELIRCIWRPLLGCFFWSFAAALLWLPWGVFWVVVLVGVPVVFAITHAKPAADPPRLPFWPDRPGAGGRAAAVLIGTAVSIFALGSLLGLSTGEGAGATLPRINAWGLAISAGLWAPFVEEWYFRGVMLPNLRARYGAPTAVALSSVLFGLIHLTPAQLPKDIGVGLLFGYVVHREGAWLSAFTLHLGINATAVAIGLADEVCANDCLPTLSAPVAVVAGLLGGALVAVTLRQSLATGSTVHPECSAASPVSLERQRGAAAAEMGMRPVRGLGRSQT